MGDMIELKLWKDLVKKQVITKFGGLKIDGGGDIIMSSVASYHRAAIKRDESTSSNITHFTNEFDVDDVAYDAQRAVSSV